MTDNVEWSHRGDSLDYTPGAAVAANEVVVQGEVVGVALRPIAANEVGSLLVEGVLEFPKAITSGKALTAGQKVYWDATNSVVTGTAGANKVAGYVEAAVADAVATVFVKLARA